MDNGRGLLYTYDKYMDKSRYTKLVKVGTSLGIVIPKPILDAYRLQRGDPITFSQLGQSFIVLAFGAELAALEKPIPTIQHD